MAAFGWYHPTQRVWGGNVPEARGLTLYAAEAEAGSSPDAEPFMDSLSFIGRIAIAGGNQRLYGGAVAEPTAMHATEAQLLLLRRMGHAKQISKAETFYGSGSTQQGVRQKSRDPAKGRQGIQPR